MTKNGKNTDGLGMFWRGCTGQSERGLELSLLGVVDLQSIQLMHYYIISMRLSGRAFSVLPEHLRW